MNDSIIKLEHVNFWYDRGTVSEYHALCDINLEIGRGEYVAFFGPSGSGKTSLLYLISGIEQSQEGKILINGRDVAQFTKQELSIYRQVGVGMIFQQFNLIPSLTVLGNVTLPMSFLGIGQEKAKEEGMRLLDRVGLANLADRLPNELSGGQQQRVGIVRALANNPPIIVADEPLGNLDSQNAQKVLEFLKDLNEKDGRTIIMVTHEAWSLRDVKRVFYLKDGTVTKTEEASGQSVAKSITESLYKQLAPARPSAETTAHSLAYLLMRGYSEQETKRFEFFLHQRLQGQLDPTIFESLLDKPFREGGVGLWRQKARRIAADLEEIIANRMEIERMYRMLEKNPTSPLRNDVEKIRGWLLREYKGEVSALQLLQMDELIQERLRGIIDDDILRRTLNLPRSRSGVGFSMRATEKIMEKFDSVLNDKDNPLIKELALHS